MFLILKTQSQTINKTYTFKDSLLKYEKSEISQKLAFILDYKAVLKYERKPNNSVSAQDSINFKLYKPINANNYILAKAKETNCVLINEEHNISFNRLFAMNLIDSLYNLGYRYLFLETLSNGKTVDTNLNTRKYPIISSGYYTKDPVYAEFVRKALSLGIKVLPYENTENITDYIYDKGYLRSDKGHFLEREFMMALNILKQIKQDKNAKIIVYAGYGHIREKGTAMGYYLKQLSYINPLTIDQTDMREYENVDDENIIYKSLNILNPTIFIENNNLPFVQENLRESTDIQVFFPRTTYLKGRPNWLKYGTRNEYHIPKNIEITYPCKVLAFYTNEYDDFKNQAIPIDVIELNNKKDNTPLFIPSDKNISIVFANTNGNIQKIIQLNGFNNNK